ncbi:hypothetical protein OH76DRAFT_1488926 [Lentinus brumalis]|uniref:CxC1-like cysteine cluster associated with KDZ transposases domain-containing protein n=1 Tax=Lentinus brumalis TaxID=2498619 RepID=A0A371CPD1_9APHY|nr:hypothetical protein OH76DRAFT_1488926 [Polyporus brumalis]
MSGKNRSSVSSAINLRYGRGIGRPSLNLVQRPGDSQARQQEAYRKYRERVSGLSYEDQEGYATAGDTGFSLGDLNLYPVPGGEEGTLLSHEGGEEDLCRKLYEPESKSLRHDGRSRRDRTESRNKAWSSQVPTLAKAFLAWKQRKSSGLELPPPEGTLRTWRVLVVDFFASAVASFTPCTPTEDANTTLANHGYLGVAPVFPSTAISFQTLEAYRQLHGACPRLSIQAFCQGLAGLHMDNFRHAVAEQFSIAYDVYNDILHHVDCLSASALGRDRSDWRMHNACAPCLYRLEGEPAQKRVLLASMDGNSSLKLVDDTFRSGDARPDQRTWRTDLFISAEEVDKFKDEVRDAQKKSGPVSVLPAEADVPIGFAIAASTDTAPSATDSAVPLTSASAATSTSARRKRKGRADAATPHVSAPADPTPLDVVDIDGEDEEHGLIIEDTMKAEEPMESTSVCTERWRNAGPEARKKMFALFATTGIFACLCRHGQVLVLCDMIRSGELMKYPLAIVNKIINVYGPEISIALGYDIACEFSKTLGRSSLGARASETVSGVVPAFHGHSHNHRCQLDWHPMYMADVGKEDFEGCERFFSFSNGLAASTRLATAFHRHQAIEGLVAFWSRQKHGESGRFIFNNYRQALKTIEEGERALEVYARDLKTTPEDYERYLQEEREYLRGLMAEPTEFTMKVEYMDALHKLEDARVKDKAAIDNYKTLDYQIIHKGIKGKQITAIKREYRVAQTRLQQAEEAVCRLEETMDIESRWLPDSDEYLKTTLELGQRKYRRALDNLERLVVQRLFELSKLGMNGIGYKLREKIGHALKARAEAIRKALSEYNRHARALVPPRPELSWTDIMEMASVGEFDLLRDARQDIREKPWAQRTHRDAMNAYFSVKRAREEIERLNLEIPRLFSSMIDEHVDYHHAMQQIAPSDAALAHELAIRQQYSSRVNQKVVRWLQKTAGLPGFSGRVVYGQRIGRDPSRLVDASLPHWATRVGGGDGAQGAQGDVDDDPDGDADEDIPGIGIDESSRFVKFVDRLG